jgi:hypothetical protein
VTAPSVETAIKSNGNWTLGGSKEVSHRVGISVGYTNKGPHYAKRYKAPIEYVKIKNQYICSASIRSTWYKIEPKRYEAPSGGALGKVGKDVSGRDGSANFNRSKNAYRNYLEPGNAQLSRGKGVKFGGAVSFCGVSMGAKTGYDSNHKQKITAGNESGKPPWRSNCWARATPKPTNRQAEDPLSMTRSAPTTAPAAGEAR